MSAPLRRALAEYALLVHQRGWVANHDGNLSAKLPGSDRFLITPTGVSKRLSSAETLVECDAGGRPSGAGSGGRGKPPSEVAIHAGAYAARPDVTCVIHAHPPHASAFALVQAELGPVAMPEVVVSLGEHIPLVPLFVPKDDAVGAAVGAALQGADVALLAGNGVVAVGPDLETAYLRVELLEHYAHILCIARGGVGEPVPLGATQRAALLDLRKKAGLARGPAPAATATAAPMGDLRAVVAEEVRRVLGGKK